MTTSSTTTLASVFLGALIGLTAGTALAHGDASQGNWQDNEKHYAKNSSGECWRAGYWTPAMAVAECDPDLVKKPEAKKAEVKKQDTVPATPLVPNLGPDKPALRVTIQAEALFDFNKADLRNEGKSTLDTEVVAKMKAHPEVELLLVTGHADRIGSDKYNQALSEKRADAVKAYLVNQGIESNRIEAVGKGEAEPVAECKDIKGVQNRKNKNLVECLQPNRRVVAEVKVQAPSK
jgi:OmpA-OmpF porin, OOP family